jgi:N-acetylneuraminic acid mutarotase
MKRRLSTPADGYNPSTDSWTATPTGGTTPVARYLHTAAWTGAEMIVWGGNNGTSFLSSGARFNPSTGSWTPTATTGAPTAREHHTAVWTGTEMIIWGGSFGPGTALFTGSRYNPSTDTWTPTNTFSQRRREHSAVWTGTEMIVWGGYSDSSVLQSGARYNPSTNNWIATNPTGAPAARYKHTAVWTGAEMIIWGGSDTTGVDPDLDTGGRFNPSTNSWAPTSTGPNVPRARQDHAAVWTGTEMLVWGGYNVLGPGDPPLNTGGRYDPSNDSWIATATSAGEPTARREHTAVWTGTEMIVWGGYEYVFELNTGGRYTPSIDTWVPTSTGANTPTARILHTAVWSGAEMIVWGGEHHPGYLNTGGRYAPSTDAWIATLDGCKHPDQAGIAHRRLDRRRDDRLGRGC